MSRSIAVLPRCTAGLALAAALAVVPTVLPSGGDNAEARTIRQCANRLLGCQTRCADRAAAKYGMKSKQMQVDAANCEKRTCSHQYDSCAASASDAKKPTKAVAEPTGAGPNTKVQPKWQPGKVGVPDKAVPVTRVPPNVQPIGGVQTLPGSGGQTFRRSR